MTNHFSLLTKSLWLAAQYHAQQQRKSDGSPYINHLIEVVDMLVNIAHVQDENELCAAALHDSLEDTRITKGQIANEFGICVLEMVEALTDNKTLSLTERRASILEKLPCEATSVQRIKLADICSNASAIPCGWSNERLTEYFVWLDQVAKLCKNASPFLYDEYLKRRAIAIK
ncbi:HD domain-containing protein [Pseudoalteromonas sp. Isolate3]|uniref:HD domain-containing protein n=1 Tax=Pseudoalteromonas sp. Isolate3 TaxID=2908526 RepID=UPI001EFC3F53|nr:HD domain-containing protein [Pseudoalteromonas sp. Isolate3]MCG9707419.1 HD domain-containing protein [Pseudoalteromonas sp. Isolate3]